MSSTKPSEKCCPKCQSKLKLEWINLDKMILLCPGEKCVYPLDQKNVATHVIRLPKKVKVLKHPELYKKNKKGSIKKEPKIDQKDKEKILKKFKRYQMVELPKLDIDLKQYQLREIPDIDKLWKEKQARIKEKEFDVEEEVQKKQLDNFAIDEEKEFEQFHNEHDMECQQSSPNPFKSRYDNLSKGNFEIIPSPEPFQLNETPKKTQNQFTVSNENVNENVNENLVDTIPNDNLTEGIFDMVPNLDLNQDVFGAIPNHDLNQNIFNSVLNDVISQDIFGTFPNNMNQNLYDAIPEDEHIGNNQHNNISMMDNSFHNLFTFKEEDMEMNYDEFNLQDSNNLALNQSFNELANLGQAYGLNASENNTDILENNQNHNQSHQEHWKHIEGLNQSNTFSDADNFLNKDFDFEHDSIQLKLAKNVFKEM